MGERLVGYGTKGQLLDLLRNNGTVIQKVRSHRRTVLGTEVARGEDQTLVKVVIRLQGGRRIDAVTTHIGSFHERESAEFLFVRNTFFLVSSDLQDAPARYRKPIAFAPVTILILFFRLTALNCPPVKFFR